MNKLFYVCVLFSFFSFSQQKSKKQITAILKDSIKIEAKSIFGVDNFGTLYYTSKNNSFHKKTKDTIITYANFQLGEITSANTFNPLKINLFYKDFNTVVVLDNRLAEIAKIDFNTTQPYKNISFVSSAYNNSFWIFNEDYKYLELYDFQNKKIKLKTMPIQSRVIDLKSDYNYCYLLTENFLYVYNYFGSLIQKIKNENYESLAFSEAHIFLKSNNKLYFLEKNESTIQPIKHSFFLIKQFLVTNESLYLYHKNSLRHYQLKIE
ncbi:MULTISPECIES: hypothetical protein [Winogradskyella]|uniref:hypothetical protein n=1 Tax=Winogradskyella TaxID=286104 RepID=UPI0015CCADE3|nr:MULTISPECIES: hypothetical protein [Winogradskyella]QXP77683.1 hypothetical protein H0I32_10650 [Winogradskyella sp. HaHa_3_26]